MKQDIWNIEYTNSKNETSAREIIPTTIPSDNIKAIDVSDLSESEKAHIKELLAEYNEYVEHHRASMFNFETWVNHSKGEEIAPKWRTFNKDRIKTTKE